MSEQVKVHKEWIFRGVHYVTTLAIAFGVLWFKGEMVESISNRFDNDSDVSS